MMSSELLVTLVLCPYDCVGASSRLPVTVVLMGSRAMTSLLVEASREGGLALASEIYSPHLDLHQRLLILDVMAAAATEMATPPSTARAALKDHLQVLCPSSRGLLLLQDREEGDI